jgi:hypothetical protein
MLNDRPTEQDVVFREILIKKLSVREVERISRKIATDKVRKKDWQNSDPELIEIERQFTETFGTRVQIQKTDFGGKLTIDYFASEDLRKVLDIIHKAESSVYGGTATKLLAHLEASIPLEQVPPQNVVAENIPAPVVVDEFVSPTDEEHFTKHDSLDVPEVNLTEQEAHEEYDEHETVEDVLEKVALVQAEQPIVEPVVTPTPEPEKSDETDLYSIKNFSL